MATLFTLRVLAVLVAALTGAYFCRGRSAAVRHFILAAGVVAALLSVPFGTLMPAWTVAVPAARSASVGVGATPRGAAFDLAVRVAVPAPAAVGAAANRGGALPWWRQAAVWATVLWLMGAAAVGLWLVAGLIGLRRASARTAPLDDARWLRMRDTVAADLGVRRTVSLRIGHSTVGTWGTFRPRVVLPREALGWSDDCARAVLAHEFAHVRRHDWALLLAANGLCALNWFNPVAWIVASRLRDEGERACDDVVLHSGVGDHAYASHLLDIARGGRGPVLAAAMSMARPSTLEGRITAMLNPAIDRRRPSVLIRIAAAVLLLAAASAGAVRVVAQQAGPLPLEGAVFDTTGGVLPAVEMALVNEQGVRWSSPTDGQGRFEFAPVGAGKYVLEASIPGFRTFSQEIVLERAKDWSKNITLQVGQLQETINVVARRPRTPVAAPAPAAAAGPVRVGGNIKVPAKVFNVSPVYPASMQEAGLEGVVKLDVLIATDGTVASVRVVSAPVHPEFVKAASAAVEKWRFTPTLLNGAPVEVEMTASISFSLSD